jgi:hypothetical protein
VTSVVNRTRARVFPSRSIATAANWTCPARAAAAPSSSIPITTAAPGSAVRGTGTATTRIVRPLVWITDRVRASIGASASAGSRLRGASYPARARTSTPGARVRAVTR